jgi:hypothetical protein
VVELLDVDGLHAVVGLLRPVVTADGVAEH